MHAASDARDPGEARGSRQPQDSVAGMSTDLEVDPLIDDPRVPEFFGESYDKVEGFRRMLVREGELRGLIGPREVGRLWERHLLNSAAAARFLPDTGTIIDVGSGAGLPGVVLGAMRPEARVVLIEPMDRRTTWLSEVVSELGLTNVEVLRGRADEFHGAWEADAVTARAVAPLDKLVRWCLPLLAPGGILVALKGRSAQAELDEAKYTIRKFKGVEADVHDASTIEGVDSTAVVTVVRQTGR